MCEEGFSDRKIGKREVRGTEPPEGEGNRQEGDIAPRRTSVSIVMAQKGSKRSP